MLKALRQRLARGVKSFAVGHDVLAEAVDLAGGRALKREARAMLAGRIAYEGAHARREESYAVLRRNVHRLEKGLIMRPRRATFALDFILPTVRAYHRLCDHLAGRQANAELVWAHDVLSAYFDAVQGEEAPLPAARALFQAAALPAALDEARTPARPFRRAETNPAGIAPDDFLALARYRRSVRWYRQQQVPRDLIDRAVAVAQQAPSACNRQSFQLRIFDDPQRVREVIGIPLGTKGFGDNVPAVAVVVGRLRAYPSPRDRHAIYVDGSLAAMSFVFAAETLGLASCLVNWADQEPQEAQMARLLGLEADERVIVLIAFGFPDPEGMVPFSAKRELDQLRRYG